MTLIKTWVQATKMDPKMAGKHLTIIDYEKSAWDDFAANQIAPFENIPMPFYLGIGNHETIPPKNRCQFSKQFARLLEKPELHNSKTDLVSGAPAAAKPAIAKNSKSDATEAAPSDDVKAMYGLQPQRLKDLLSLDQRWRGLHLPRQRLE